MIKFRCWYCNRRYRVVPPRVGEKLHCTCDHWIRVPRRDGGNSRIKTPLDWFLEITLYGGGGGLLGLGLALLILAKVRFLIWWDSAVATVLSFTLFGFLVGALAGERGVLFLGKWIRDKENS